MIAHSLYQPTHTAFQHLKHKRATCDPIMRMQYLFSLSTPKVYLALAVTNQTVGTYSTFSPLLCLKERSIFCGTCCHLVFRPGAFLLGSRVLYVARTFLPRFPKVVSQLACILIITNKPQHTFPTYLIKKRFFQI